MKIDVFMGKGHQQSVQGRVPPPPPPPPALLAFKTSILKKGDLRIVHSAPENLKIFFFANPNKYQHDVQK